ncbi:MAG: LEPR-XLL domain-containing protein, partial [Prevotella sp.]
KKTNYKNHSQNDFNSFRMEALEPRLLMAADLPTALHEQLEAMQVDTVVSGFTNNNSQLQSEVSFLGGNLKSLSNLVKDSGSTLQGTLSGKLEAALDTLQPSGSFGDLSALADALDAASVSLGDDWTAGLDATASGSALDLKFDISKSVTGATLDIKGAEFSLSALTAGFTADLSLELSTTTVDGVTGYAFSAPDAALNAYAKTEIQDAADAGFSYQGLSLNEADLDETEPDISLEIKTGNAALSAALLSVDLEFALSGDESIVTFPDKTYLTVKGDASNLDVSVPALKLANTAFLNNVSIDNLKNKEVPFLRANGATVSFLKLFSGDPKSTTNPVENSISTGAAQVYAAVQQALSQMTSPSLQSLNNQVTAIQTAANTALQGAGYSIDLESAVNESATPQSLTYSIVLKKKIDSGYDFLLGKGLSLIKLDDLNSPVELEMAFGMTVSLDAQNRLQVASDGFSFENIGVDASIGMENTQLNLGLLKATAESGSELKFSFALSQTDDGLAATDSTAGFTGGVTLYGPDGSDIGTYDFAEGEFKYETGAWTMPGEWSAFEDVGAGTVLSQLNAFLQYVDTTVKVLASESLEMGLTNGSVSQLLTFAESIKNLLYVKDTNTGKYTEGSLVELDEATQQLKAHFSNWTELQTKLTALAENAGFVGSPLISFDTAADSVIPKSVSLTLSFETGFTGDAYLSLAAAASSLSDISTDNDAQVHVDAQGTLSFTMTVDLKASSQNILGTTTLANLDNYSSLTNDKASITNDQFAITATDAVAGTLSSDAIFQLTSGASAKTITLKDGTDNTTLSGLAADLSAALKSDSNSDYEVLSLNSALQVISNSEFSFSQGTGAYSQLGFSGSTLQTVVSATLTDLNVGDQKITFNFSDSKTFTLTIPSGAYSTIDGLLSAINGEFSRIQDKKIGDFGFSTFAGVYGIYAMGYQQDGGYRILFACDPAKQKLDAFQNGTLTSITSSTTGNWTFGTKQYMLQSITQYSQGRLGSDFELGLTVNGTVYTVSLAASNTLYNNSLSDLAVDLNGAMDSSLKTLLAFSVSGNSLVLKALNDSVTAFSITSANSGAQQAGFAPNSPADTNDLRVSANGVTYGFDAGAITGAMTLDDLLNKLNGQNSNAVVFSIEGDHLEATANGTRVDAVTSINGSTLAELLGLSNLNAECPGTALMKSDAAARFSFTDVQLGADVSLAVDSAQFTATWGALGVTGTANGTLSASMALVFATASEKKTLDNLRILDLTPSVTVGTDKTLTCDLSASVGSSSFSAGSLALTLGKNAKTSALELSAAVAANPLPQMTGLSMANLFSMATNLQGKISDITDRLDQTIPVVNRNLKSLITISENLTSIIAKLRAQNLTTVQGFVDNFNQALTSIFSDVYCTASVVSGVLNLDLQLTQGFSSRDRFSFESCGNNLSGAAELYTQGKATLTLGVALTNNSLTLTKAITLDVKFNVSGDNLKFNLSMGITGLEAISQLIEVGNGSFIAFGGLANLTLGSAGMSFYSSSTGAGYADLNYSVTAKGKLSLTVAGISLGDIQLGAWDASKNAVDISGSKSLNLQDFSASLRTDVSNTNFASDSLVLDLSAIVDKLRNFNSLDFFDKLKLVADGLDAFLETVGDGLNTALAENVSKVPVVGAALADGIDVFGTLQNNVVDRLREFVYSASDLDAQSVAAFLNTLFGNYLDGGFDSTVWGSNWSTLEEQASGGVQYGYDLTSQVAEWAFTLGGKYDLGTDVDLDLGMPGLNLSSDGGVDLSLGWRLSFGFGISKSEGFYLILPEGKELSLSASAKLAATLTGSLGFLGLKMDTKTSPYATSADVNVYLDLWNGKLTGAAIPAISPSLTYDALVDIDAGVTLGIVTDLGDDSPSFPNLTADFKLTWAWNKLPHSQGLNTLGFSDIKMDMGAFISKVLGPIVKKIQTVTAPMQPIIDFLTTPFPVLKDLGYSVTPLELAKQYAGKYFDSGMITALQDLITLADKITTFNEKLSASGKSLTIGLKDYYFVGGAKPLSDVDKETVKSFLNGTTALDSAAIANYANELSTNTKTSADFANNLGSDFSDVTDSKSNWKFFWDNPNDIFKLFFGENIPLVTYDMPALNFSFDWNQFYRIYGPLGVRVGVDFGINIDLKFGYDTQGIADFIKSGNSNYGCLVNGFYIDDCNDAGKDVNELTLYGGLSAAAELNAGVSAGVGGGVNIEAGFDLYDPNHDGKVRLKEMAQTIADTGAFSLFDMKGKISAELFAYIDLWLYTKKWNITDPITIATFSYTWARKAVLAERSGSDVVVNVGSNAGSRLNGDTTDGNEEIQIDISGNSITGTSFNGKPGSDSSKVSVKDGGKLYVDAGNGDDKIILKGTADFDIEIHGGSGDDVIDLSGLTLNSGYAAVIYGGAGNDTIIGSNGFNIIFGDDGTCRITRSDDKKTISSYVATGTAVAGVAGNDIIFGNSGTDVIFGGAGDDSIANYGTEPATGKDILIGDAGRVTFSEKETVIDRTQSGAAGDDTIIGSAGDDTIYGGLGNDRIDGGAGVDTIYGEKGNDLIYGGSGDDIISGGEGMDIIFGDGLASSSLNLSPIFGEKAFSYEFKTFWNAKLTNSWSITPITISASVSYTKYSQYDKTLLKVSSEDFSAAGAVYGSDTISGDSGSDVIFGDGGALAGVADTISGGVDNDLIDGDGGDDTLNGDTGNDVVYGGAGNDIISGGAGDDKLYGDAGLQGFVSLTSGTKIFSKNDTNADQETTYGTNYGLLDTLYAEQKSSETETGDDTIDVGSGMDFADGQGGNDTVQANFSGGSTSGVANIFDSGDAANSSADRLLIRGTVENDSILIRSAADGLGFVALVPSDDEENSKQNIERVNLWHGGIDRVSVDAAGGDDTIAVDGTVADTTVSGASGSDTIQVGQVYKSARISNDSTGITADDAFNTVETTEGFLSDGVSENTSLFVQGNSGDDIINIYHNVGSLNLQGNSGNDNFSIRGFTTVKGDTVTNGAMSLDGGAGNDSMLLRGSEGEDVFVITKQGVSSNVVSVEVSGVESTTLDGAAGDDTFNIQGNNDYDTTVIDGGLGNDTVNNGGSSDSLVLRSANLKGQTSLVNHSVYVAEDSDTAYNDAKIASADFTVVDTSTEPAIVFLDANGSKVVYPTLNLTEGTKDSFYVSVVGLTSGEMTVTLSVPSLSESDVARNERALALSLTADGKNLEQSLVVRFRADQLTQTADGYYKVQVYVYALEDTRLDGSVLSTISAKGAIVGSFGALKNQVEPIKVVVNDAANPVVEPGFIAKTDSFRVSSASGRSFKLNQANPQSLKVYLSDRASALTASDYTISGDTLTLSENFYNTLMTEMTGQGTGSVDLLVHYSTNTLTLTGENYVELAYEQVYLSTFVMKLNDQVILSEEGLAAYNKQSTQSENVNTNYYYKLDGGQLLFYSVSLHKLVGLKGTLILEGGFDRDGIDGNLSSVTPVGTRNSSSVVPEIAIAQVDTTVVENSAFTVTYTVSLSGSVAEGKKVYVLVNPAETPYLYDANGNLLRAKQLAVSVEGSTSFDYLTTDPNEKGILRLIFDSANTSFTIRVSALQDDYTENASIVEIPAGINTISDIDGPVYAYGAGDTGKSSLADPMLLEHSQMLSKGTNAFPETNLYASLLSMLSVSGKTMVVSSSVLNTLASSLIGADSFTEESQLKGHTITFVLGTSESALYRIESASLENDSWTLTLNSAVSQAFSDVSTVKFVLGAVRDSLFVNESESVDRFFVNNQDNVNDATSSLSSLRDAVSWSNASDYENAMGTDAQALRFSNTGLSSDGLSFSDFEYAEMNLGTGSDTVEMAASVARSDAFQAFTVLNSGAGDDTVAVTSYQSMNGSELGKGTLGNGERSESETSEEQFVYTISSFTMETTLTKMSLSGWYMEITDASGATERRTIKSGEIVNGSLSNVALSRDFSMPINSSTAFRIVGPVIAYGNIGTNAIETIDTDPSEDAEKWVTSVTLTPVWSNLATSVSAGDVLVLTDANGVETRTIIASVNGNVVALSHTLNTLNYVTYRIETKLSDDQLVINAQEGNDTVTATGDITREGLIVFGGYGADAITVDNSAYVFGDRGQVIYTDVNGKVVTR